METLIPKIIGSIREYGLQYTAEKLLDNRYDIFRREGIHIDKKKAKILLHRQKVGFQMYSALLGSVEGERTPELAVENLVRFLRKRPYLKSWLREIF